MGLCEKGVRRGFEYKESQIRQVSQRSAESNMFN